MSMFVRLWAGLVLVVIAGVLVPAGFSMLLSPVSLKPALMATVPSEDDTDKLPSKFVSARAEADLPPSQNPLSQNSLSTDKLNEHKAVPAADKPLTDWFEIRVPVAVRTEPGRSKPALLIPKAGSQFPLLEEGREWNRILVSGEQEAWVPRAAGDKLRLPASVTALRAELRPDTVLRIGPGPRFAAVLTVAEQPAAIPLQINGTYVKVRMEATGRTGWIAAADIAAWEPGAEDQPPAKPAMASVLAANELPLAGRTIVVDAGHGGKDKGAIGDSLPVYEKDVNLAIAKVLSAKLQAAGAKVILTRRTDVFIPLEGRTAISNDSHADAFVSIHQNMFPQNPDVAGTQTYYDSEDGSKLAEAIEGRLNTELHPEGAENQTVEERYYVLRHNERPAVLVEGCFLSNPDELKASVLPDYAEKTAEGIYAGLLDYLGNSR